MNQHNIPSFFHMATIVFIDDDKDFLESIKLAFNEFFPIKTFDDPVEAARYLKEADSFSNHNDSPTHKKICDINRYKQVGVVMVDYDMPKMNGIDFCKKISDLSCQKVILTGRGDMNSAIDAFNKKIIDQYVVKNPGTIREDLIQTISQQLKQYFMNTTSSDCYDKAILHSEDYANLIERYTEDFKNEYYVIDHNGSCLIINNDGEISWLFVKTEKDKNDIISLIQESDIDFDLTLINHIEEKNLIPILWENHEPKSMDEISRFLVPAIKSNNSFFNYVYIKNDLSELFGIEQEIKTLKDYLDMDKT